MTVMAFVFPVLLILGSWISTNIVLQGSISAFYHTPMRNLFVGVLVAIGSFLYLYKGFTSKENIALNIAGIFAVGVAFFPTSIPPEVAELSVDWLPRSPFIAPYIHGFSAVLFFLAIAYVCIFCGNETVALIKNKKIKRKYLMIYRMIGVLMVVLPSLAVLFSFFAAREYLVFIFEFVAIWVFAFFWLFKIRELRHHSISLRQLIENDSTRID